MGSRHFNTYQLKHFILLLCLMLLFSASQAQKNTFIRTYNLPGMNGGLDLALLSDGGFVGTGQHADGGGTCRVYAYRIDECGNLIWFNLYASGGGIAINETQNDGIIIGGEMDGHGASLLKVDNIGGIEWSKYYSGMGNYMCSAIETSNGSYFIGGEGVIAKTNQQGDVLWSANVAPGKVHSVDEFSNGDYLYLSLSLTGATFYLGRVSANGFLIWENSYGQPGGTYDSHYDWAGDAMIDKNDNIIVTSNSDNDNGNIVISKLDGNGNVMIAKDVGSSSSTDLVRSIAEGLNDGFILGGATYGYNTSSVSQITQNIAHAPENLSGRDILLLKFDDLLNLEWSSVIGSSGSDKGIGVRANNDNGYTISAYTDGTFFNANSFDPLFIKTDSVGSVGCQQYSPNLPESSITLNKITTTFFSSSSIVEANFTPTTTNISPSDYFMCLDCSTVPSFYISDTTICVGDTTFFINESSGLLCFQDWYVDGQLIQADTDSIPFVFDVGGLHTIELVTNCGNGSVSFILDIYVNYIDFQITSQSDFNGFEVSCYDFNDGFIETIATSPYPPITFNWTGGATTSNVYNLTSDDYFLNITDDFGCTIDTVVEVTQPDAITNTIQSLFDYNGYDISCYNLNDGEIFSNTIGGVSPYSYTWAGPNGYTSNTEDINSLYAGTYFLNIVDDNGCIYNSNINLNEPEGVNAYVVTAPDTCSKGIGFAEVIYSGGVPPIAFLWDDKTTLSYNSSLSSGENLVLLTDGNTCVYEIYFNINNLVGPVADFSASGYSYDFFEQLEQEINFYDSSYDEWSNIDSWNWDVGDQTIYFNQDISHSYDSIGQYYVQLIIENVSGCRDTIIKMVNIKGYKVHIPNSFTPHNDEINNVFKPVGVGIESYEMTIYNRWGERLYSTKEIAMGWNGMYEGRKVQAGVYAYKISVIDVFGESHFYTGEIHLIR